MAEFGTGKTIFILTIVVGCFAVLWPKIFYPMLMTSISGEQSPVQSVPPIDTSEVSSSQCCGVIFETDVTAIKVLTEMCGHILHAEKLGTTPGHLPKQVVERCRDEVLSACGLDITAIIKDNVRLTKNYKQILDEIRSYNNSACLKRNFGVQLSLLGTPRQLGHFREKTARHLRPERPAHLHPDMLHPALREKGRAIPQQKPLSVGSITGLDGATPRVTVPGHPMPGMRPPMGGAGHVVPAPKGSGTMGIIMPLYTVGIVIFFVYTIMKMLFKKTDERSSKAPEYGIDPELRRMMFGAAAMEECAAAAQQAAAREETARRVSPEPAQANGFRAPAATEPPKPTSKLVVTAISGLIAEVDQQILASEAKNKLNLIKEEDRKSDVEDYDDIKTSDDERQEPEVVEEIVSDEVVTLEKKVTFEQEDEELIEETEVEETEPEVEESKPEVIPQEEPEVITQEEPEVIQQEEEEEIEEEEEEEEEEEQEIENKAVTNGHATIPERTTTPVQQLLEEGSGKVTVLGMETTASCEGGQRWTGRPPTPDTPPRSTTPLLPLYAIEQFAPPPVQPPPHYRWARPPTPPTPPRSTTPLSHIPSVQHSYLLETAPGVVQGGQHGILVSDSECEAVPVRDPETETEDEDSPPVILSGKMTLSVISLPDAAGAAAPSEQQQQSSAGLSWNFGAMYDQSYYRQWPASPALPRRAMHVEQPQLEEIAAPQPTYEQESVPEEDRVKEAVNGTQEEEDDKLEQHLSNGGPQQEENTATNYTTASAAAAEETGEHQEETSADISGIDDEHAEAADNDEPAAEVEDLPEDNELYDLHGQSNGLL